MPAYMIIQIKIRDPRTYERYKEMATPTVAAYQGRYLVRGGPTHTLEGSWQPPRLVVLEFPNAELGRAWWSSPEYAPAKALRQSCADTEMLLTDGLSV